MSIDIFTELLNSPVTNTPEDISVVRRMIATQADADTLADMLGIGEAA